MANVSGCSSNAVYAGAVENLSKVAYGIEFLICRILGQRA
jgi:hypothetical protein